MGKEQFTERFSGKAGIYSQYRPSYPDAFIDYLYNEVCFKAESIIADIGSGTGKLTEQLLKQKSFVYGVEPNDDMRNMANELLSNYPNYKSVAATAEDTELPNDSVDFITAAQAFQWFDSIRFKAECQRILKKNGKVILVRNERDFKNEMVGKNVVINNKYTPERNRIEYTAKNNPSAGSHNTYKPGSEADLYIVGAYEYKELLNIIEMEEEVFIGWNLSGSYAPNESDVSYESYIAALKELFNEYRNGNCMSVPFITKSYVGTV